MNYTRDKNKLIPAEGDTIVCKSINEAKRQSRKLQSTGNKVSVVK